MTEPQFISPDWPAPSQVCAAVTTRTGGVSQAPYDGFNLADHVDDDLAAVASNRRILVESLNLSAEPLWLKQVHGRDVAEAPTSVPGAEADAAVTREPGQVLVVMTADCLPVLFCDRHGTRIGAAHAGWRGLAGGVLEATVEALDCPPAELLAWLGPAIGPKAFEVGAEVREAFMENDARAAGAFVPSREGRYLADLYALARLRLGKLGLSAVHGGGLCTYTDAARFYSYRRDGATGRMASLIWLEET